MSLRRVPTSPAADANTHAAIQPERQARVEEKSVPLALTEGDQSNQVHATSPARSQEPPSAPVDLLNDDSVVQAYETFKQKVLGYLTAALAELDNRSADTEVERLKEIVLVCRTELRTLDTRIRERKIQKRHALEASGHPAYPPPKRLRVDVTTDRLQRATQWRRAGDESGDVADEDMEGPLLGCDAERMREGLAHNISLLYSDRLDSSWSRALIAAGPRRAGSSRIAREVVRVIKQMRVEAATPYKLRSKKMAVFDVKKWAPDFNHCLDPLCIKVDFRGDSRFTAQFDGYMIDNDPALHFRSEKMLATRVAAAAGALRVVSASGETAPIDFKAATSVDLDVPYLPSVLDAIVAVATAEMSDSAADKSCLPIVLHIDGFDSFIDDAAEDQRADAEKVMRKMLDSLIGDRYHRRTQKHFVVPIITGTSCGLARSAQSSHVSLSPLPLSILSFEESCDLLAHFWARAHPLEAPPALDAHTPDGSALLLAVGEMGGFPGLIEEVAELSWPSEQGDAVRANVIEEMVARCHHFKKPPPTIAVALARLVVARKVVYRGSPVMTVKGASGEDPHLFTVGDALDNGYVTLVLDPIEHPVGDCFTLSVPLVMLRTWPSIDSAFDLTSVPIVTSPGTPWTWADFKRMHANHMSSVLAVLTPSWESVSQGARLGHLLRGAQPSHAPELEMRLSDEPWALRVVEEEKEALIYSRRQDTVSLEEDGVHICAAGTHVVDAYVNMKLNSSSATVFFQYSQPGEQDGVLTVEQLNNERKRLDKYLQKRADVWEKRLTLLVVVTNRVGIKLPVKKLVQPPQQRRDGREPAPPKGPLSSLLPGVLYIARDALADHLGPSLAARGLVPKYEPRIES